MQHEGTIQQQGNLRIYGCGGCGINIASTFDLSPVSPEEGHAVAHPVYIDTSRSNLKTSMTAEYFAVLEGIDGSGKIRRENHEAIGKSVKNILQTHKPMDFNIVVFSASGGSGSVFGPLIISELLGRGLPVVAIVIGSDESAITAENTLKTLKSLEAVAERAQLPVVIHYDHNDRDVKRSAVDADAKRAISSLATLASRQNAELDSRDIANWVQFSRTTSVRPRLALLAVYRDNESLADISHPVSIASLYNSPDDPKVDKVPDYSCDGYPIYPSQHFKVEHFVITIDGVQVIVGKLNAKVSENDTLRSSRIDHNSIVSDKDKVTEDGLVL
jgi:hypothetical protein